jgi:hypothetical protein
MRIDKTPKRIRIRQSQQSSAPGFRVGTPRQGWSAELNINLGEAGGTKERKGKARQGGKDVVLVVVVEGRIERTCKRMTPLVESLPAASNCARIRSSNF